MSPRQKKKTSAGTSSKIQATVTEVFGAFLAHPDASFTRNTITPYLIDTGWGYPLRLGDRIYTKMSPQIVKDGLKEIPGVEGLVETQFLRLHIKSIPVPWISAILNGKTRDLDFSTEEELKQSVEILLKEIYRDAFQNCENLGFVNGELPPNNRLHLIQTIVFIQVDKLDKVKRRITSLLPTLPGLSEREKITFFFDGRDKLIQHFYECTWNKKKHLVVGVNNPIEIEGIFSVLTKGSISRSGLPKSILIFTESEEDLYELGNCLLRHNEISLLYYMLHWLSKEFDSLLEEMPSGLESEVEERKLRFDQLKETAERLSVLQHAHFVASIFLNKMSELTVDEELLLETFGFDQAIRDMRIGETQTSMKLYSDRLNELESEISRRIEIEKLTLDSIHEEQQNKLERSYHMLSAFLAAMVIFEILTAGVTWMYSSTDPVGQLAYLYVLISSFIIIILVLGKYSDIILIKGEKSAISQSKESVTQFNLLQKRCPHCNAIYQYRISHNQQSIRCQNCDKEFKINN